MSEKDVGVQYEHEYEYAMSVQCPFYSFHLISFPSPPLRPHIQRDSTQIATHLFMYVDTSAQK